MRVKIGKRWYEAKKGQSIAVEFADEEKRHLREIIRDDWHYFGYKMPWMTRDEFCDWVAEGGRFPTVRKEDDWQVVEYQAVIEEADDA